MADEQMIWRGVADDEGMIKVPNTVAGQTLLLRHAAAASAIVLFSANEAVTITMHSAAPPLIAKLVRHDGTPIGSAAARITFWIGGVRVSGPAAGFMTFSLGASTSDGRWIARRLSPAPLRILATRRTSPAQIRAGALDAIATNIAYPWASAVSLTLADE